ncbi:hypothetical protein DAI22_03g280700 [Oryza sativa Japonica Group]|nr:hypothetical protein DAI22_03g280700 [Oryza sativa Japonica Group]
MRRPMIWHMGAGGRCLRPNQTRCCCCCSSHMLLLCPTLTDILIAQRRPDHRTATDADCSCKMQVTRGLLVKLMDEKQKQLTCGWHWQDSSHFEIICVLHLHVVPRGILTNITPPSSRPLPANAKGDKGRWARTLLLVSKQKLKSSEFLHQVVHFKTSGNRRCTGRETMMSSLPPFCAQQCKTFFLLITKLMRREIERCKCHVLWILEREPKAKWA